MTTQVDRRTVFGLGMGAVATAAVATAAGQTSAQTVASAAKVLEPQPLPFDPKAIAGLSEKILTSHHANNYTGAVKRLNAIEAEITKLDLKSAPVFAVNGLKREELIALNSAVLHEIYFRSIGPANRTPGAALADQIETDFGSHARWALEFSAMGKALGGGSGWVLLTWSPRFGRLVNTRAADHTMTAADGQVLLALDMYEHAYQMDYGAKAAAYVDAYMATVDWAYASSLFKGA
ncbi:superoxide dismutase [Asticcacaulis sp. W401b]|uniref:superoxide dismutase n=1 Tax=Asticcacaulis sp. W401b TaxID=3388666 RepID=UPI0039710F33